MTTLFFLSISPGVYVGNIRRRIEAVFHQKVGYVPTDPSEKVVTVSCLPCTLSHSLYLPRTEPLEKGYPGNERQHHR